MSERSRTSAHDRVVADYFRTTSAVGTACDDEVLARSVVGLRRRLRDWCDVGGVDVLDLGSGTGELCKLAAGLGARRVIGVNMSQEEIERAAYSDPDAQPLTPADFARMTQTPQEKIIRRALRLTQEEFAIRYFPRP